MARNDAMPLIAERLRIVIGRDHVSIDEAIERLRAHDKRWVPQVPSYELKAYVSLVLSTRTKDLFERVSRGVYKVQAVRPVRKPVSSSNREPAPVIQLRPKSKPKPKPPDGGGKPGPYAA